MKKEKWWNSLLELVAEEPNETCRWKYLHISYSFNPACFFKFVLHYVSLVSFMFHSEASHLLSAWVPGMSHFLKFRCFIWFIIIIITVSVIDAKDCCLLLMMMLWSPVLCVQGKMEDSNSQPIEGPAPLHLCTKCKDCPGFVSHYWR